MILHILVLNNWTLLEGKGRDETRGQMMMDRKKKEREGKGDRQLWSGEQEKNMQRKLCFGRRKVECLLGTVRL